MDDRARVETAVTDALIAQSTSFASLPDGEVLTAFDELAARLLELQATVVRGAAEIASRSDHLPGDESLVRRAGYGSVERLVQAKVGIRWHESKQLVAVANATRAQASLTGATLPVRSPHVASALHAGFLSIAQAHAIVAGLAKAEGRASVDDVDQAEQLLVTLACGTGESDTEPATPETLATSAKRCVDSIDPDGDEPRFQDQLDARFLRFRERSRGGYAFDGVCTDEQHEVLQSAFDASVKPRRVQFQDLCGATDEPGSDEDAVDDRTMEQRRLDALVTMVGRHAETTSPRISGEAPTVTITVAASTLQGHPDRLDDLATLNRSGDTVPVSIAARYICDAFIQAVVQDDDGHPSASAAGSGSSARRNVERSSPATATAEPQAAPPHQAGARPTTSNPGATAARPTSTTASCSASTTTPRSTAAHSPSAPPPPPSSPPTNHRHRSRTRPRSATDAAAGASPPPTHADPAPARPCAREPTAPASDRRLLGVHC